jgi:hypothetical protein
MGIAFAAIKFLVGLSAPRPRRGRAQISLVPSLAFVNSFRNCFRDGLDAPLDILVHIIHSILRDGCRLARDITLHGTQIAKLAHHEANKQQGQTRETAPEIVWRFKGAEG